MSDELNSALANICRFILSSRDESQEVKTLVNDFLRTGRVDLEDSETLMEKRSYASSIYHLQQSVEKTTKAFLLGTGMGTLDEVRRIGHDSLAGHILYAKKLSEFLPQLSSIDRRLRIDFEKAAELQRKRLEIARFSEGEIRHILKSFDAVDESMAPMTSMIVDWAPLGLLPMLKDQEASVIFENLETIKKKMGQSTPMLRAVPFLFIASSLTFPHEAFTRYPDGPIKPSDYTESMGIVACGPVLVRRMDTTLRALERLWIEPGKA